MHVHQSEHDTAAAAAVEPSEISMQQKLSRL